MRRQIGILISMHFLASITWGQQPTPQSMPGMDMSAHDKSSAHMHMQMQMQMKDRPIGADDKGTEKDSDASAHAMHSMEGHMDMGPHMKMTSLRTPKPGDAARAQEIVESARKASDKYLDYRTALADGYQIFLPEIKQNMYHFTNYGYAMEAAFRFNAEHPTSLLYEKHGDDYKLIGVMYTAPKGLSEDQLDQRIPLSVAQWHEHINFCAAPAGRKTEYLAPHPQFGLRGSITTQDACAAAGGIFHPVIFNWMVHVYPFEENQANIWSVERQHGDQD